MLLIALIWWFRPVGADPPGEGFLWHARPPQLPAVNLYFFWSSRCPHCLEARPFIESLPQRYPWIGVQSLEILEHPENHERFRQLADIAGFVPTSVPTFVWCAQHYAGYGGEHTSGQFLVAALSDCYRQIYGEAPIGFSEGIALEPETGAASAPWSAVPWLGRLDPERFSLPVLTIVMGGLDAFNPCAFFVLLFLLSLLVNVHSRARMLIVGGVFVVTSGLVYFVFMAAWLNLFQLIGGITVMTLVAGLLAVIIGLVNIKDYFWFHRGVSLTLTEKQQQRLFFRMRGLMSTEHFLPLLVGTLTLAVAANSYELLCTMGLPMVFTRMLTLEQLDTLQYYAYLALYNLVYVLPLAVIVGLFVTTLGRRKLSESAGRFLKLLSGNMMGVLGLALLAYPEQLSNPLIAVLLISVALVAAVLVHLLFRKKPKYSSTK